jgi:hypothetical protein
MSVRGDRATHRLGPPVVHTRTDRALVELPMTVEFRVDLDGVDELYDSAFSWADGA